MFLKEYRCGSCNKLLFKGVLVGSKVEVKCRGCGDFAVFHGESKDKLLCYKENCANRITLNGVKATGGVS